MNTDICKLPIDLLSINIAIFKDSDDGDFIFVDMNSMALETDQVLKEEVLNKKVTEVFPGVKKMGLFDVFVRVMESGEMEVFEMAYYQDKHISGWRKNKVIKLNDNHIMALYESIDIKKELEIQIDTFRQLKKATKVGTWSLELKNNILTLDDGTYKIFDFDKTDIIANLDNFYNTIHPEDVQRVRDAYSNHLMNKAPYKIKYKLKTKKGKIKYVKERCDTIFDNDGVAIISYGFIQDITKIKKQKNALKKKDALLMEQSKLAQMGEMLNMIAHQWRQPLNAISAAAINIAMKNEFDMLDKKDITETSEFVQEQTQNMSKIIDDFMRFNKPEKNAEFSLYKSISIVNKMISPQLKSRDITLEVDIDKEIKIFHNSKNIEHVLLNIIINARDAFEDNKETCDSGIASHCIENKKIKIFTTTDKETVTLIIEDNAGGISEDIIDKIFNPYFTTKEQGKGTGIGLYMSKQMVEAIEGSTINVEVIDRATIFMIKFEENEKLNKSKIALVNHLELNIDTIEYLQ